MNEIAVYTAISQNYEPLKENQNREGADFFAFIEDTAQTSDWTLLPITHLFSNPRRNARWHKMNSHLLLPNYKYTIWLDGSMEMHLKAQELIDKYLKGADIVAFRHPDVRDCLYEEAITCQRLNLDDTETINKQVAFYHQEGYPEHNGLAETKVVIRKNNPKVERFNRLWLYEITNRSLRDQVSFNYCVWKAKVKLNYMEPVGRCPTVYPGFTYIEHERR